jgi:hypothetical protein
MKLWHRVVLGLLVVVGIVAIVWRLSPDGQRAIPALTGILIVVTVWYADRTYEMVHEMRAARAAQVQPKIVATMDRLGPNSITPKVLSVGAGSGFDVEVTLALEPEGPSTEYVAAVLRPGRGQAFFFPDPVSKDVMTEVDEIARYDRLHIKGTCRDAFGVEITIDESLDVTKYVAAWKAGLWKRTSVTRREGKEPLEAIEEILDLIEHHIREMVQPD